MLKSNNTVLNIVFAALVGLVLAAGVGEAMRRLFDGYEMLSWPLVVKSGETVGKRASGADKINGVALALAGEKPGMMTLFDRQPVLPDLKPIPEILKKRAAASPKMGYHANYVYNRNFVKNNSGNPMFFGADFPDRVLTYDPPGKATLPRYRHFPSARLTMGIQTNRYGWRGPDLTVDKPENVIRIATLGDSTTLHQGSIRISYPEFITYWLNIWANQKGYDVLFQPINTGRESINSENVREILRTEVAPFEPDYLLFYGLGNQWDLYNLVGVDEAVGFGGNAADKYYGQSKMAAFFIGKLKSVSPWLATAGWLRRRLGAVSGGQGGEPKKPAQHWRQPVGWDEMTPDVRKLNGVPQFQMYVDDLDDMLTQSKNMGARLIVQSFKFLAYDGLRLDMKKQSNIYNYLNRQYFPYSYKNIKRVADIRNRIFKNWAAINNVDFIDTSKMMPDNPALFLDAMHNTQSGVKLRAWAVFLKLLPVVEADLKTGRLPRPDQGPNKTHPYMAPPKLEKISDITGK